MKKNVLLLIALFAGFNHFYGQTTVTKQNTLIKSNHNYGLTNPVYDESSPMTYNTSEISTKGAAFSINYTNNDGGSGFDGYPCGMIGGYNSSGTYSSGTKSACGMPVKIKDLKDELRIEWKTSQTNANDAEDVDNDVEEDKWWATINVIFDSGAETAKPVVSTRDYDLVIQNVSYKQDDFEDLAKTTNNRYWKFARNADDTIKPFSLYLNGTEYQWAVRYKFFSYESDHKQVVRNDKVHLKFIPIDNSTTIPYLNHSLKAFIDCTKDYIQYAGLTATEKTLADDKIADEDLWIKSISAGYEVYSGDSTLANDYFLTTIDATAPSTLTGLTATKDDGDDDGTDDEVDLAWTKTTEADKDWDTYTVYRSTNNGESYTVLASNILSNSYTDKSIVDGTKYMYYVTVKDHSYNESAKSNIQTVQFGDAPNAEPSDLTVTASTTNCTEVSLTWTDNSNNEDGFRISKSTDGTTYTEVGTADADATSYDATGLDGETAYTLKVVAYKDNINSTSITSGEVTTGKCTETTLEVDGDSYVRSGSNYKDVNYGTATELEIKNTGGNRYAYLKFDLSNTTVANVLSAKLHFKNTNNQAGTLKLSKVTDDTWTETGVKWSNKPAVGTLIKEIEINAIQEYNVDVKDIIVDETDGNITFVFTAKTTSELFKLSSKEGTFKPVLKLINKTIDTGSSARSTGVKDSKENIQIETDLEAVSFKVYPNPTVNAVNIKLSKGFNTESKITVYDSLGRVIGNYTTKNDTYSLNLNGKSGLYFIKVETDGVINTKKVIKR